MDVNSLIDEEEEQNDYPLEAVFPSAIEEEPDDDEKSTKSPEENNGSVSSSTVSSSNSTSTNISGSVEGILTTERGIDSSTPLSIFPDRSPATKQMMTKLPTKTTPSMTKQLPSTIPTSTGAYDAKILIKARKGLTRKKRNVIIKHNKNLEKEVAEELADKIFRKISDESRVSSRVVEDKIIECGSEGWNATEMKITCSPVVDRRAVATLEGPETTTTKRVELLPKEDPIYASPQCRVTSEKFVSYYFILLFLLCFATPVLITTSLNVFITSAVKNTHHEIISHHQWLTLAACVVMWGPCLTELLLSKWGIVNTPQPLAVFLFLLGHTHNLLRSILHAVFAQQISSFTRQGFFANQFKVSWGKDKATKVTPLSQDKEKVEEFNKKMEIPIKRKETLVPRPPAPGMDSPPLPPRRSTVPSIEIVETMCT